MDIVQQLDESLWREFINNHPQAQIFHTPEMFQVFARTKGHQPLVWAAIGRGNRLLALLLPVQVTLMDGLFRRFTTRAIAYGSVLCASGSDGEKGLATLLETYKQEMGGRVLFTELRNLSDLSQLQSVLASRGFAYEDHLNYLVDLSCTPDEVLQRMGRRTRKNIRRALRQGDVVIEEADSLEMAAACYDLLRKTYGEAQVPLADKSLFEAAFDVLHPKGMVKFLLARIGEDYAAGSVELVYKDTVYGWYGGMDRAYSKFIPNELLLWHIFCWGAENGSRVYDFGGAGKPDEEYGVRDFKAKFGGDLVCFGRNTHVPSPVLLQSVDRAYAVYRTLL
jgi:CelD/BcsL family acetyltransferase involved in cellulose biosynthesis